MCLAVHLIVGFVAVSVRSFLSFCQLSLRLREGFCNAVMDIDTLGTFTMCHAAVQYLKRGGKGKGPDECGVIISISATLQYTAQWYQIHVSAAKVYSTFCSPEYSVTFSSILEIRSLYSFLYLTHIG